MPAATCPDWCASWTCDDGAAWCLDGAKPKDCLGCPPEAAMPLKAKPIVFRASNGKLLANNVPFQLKVLALPFM